MKGPRFKPGNIFKKGNQFYCVRVIFRLQNNPNEWMYLLEERKNVCKPGTATSGLVEMIIGDSINDCILIQNPVRDSRNLPGTEAFYWYGSCEVVPNKKLLQQYQLISSGEVIIPKEKIEVDRYSTNFQRRF